jgi:hypothetical protein
MLCFTDYYLGENDLGYDRSNARATSLDRNSKAPDQAQWLRWQALRKADINWTCSPGCRCADHNFPLAAVTDITGDSDGLKDPASP